MTPKVLPEALIEEAAVDADDLISDFTTAFREEYELETGSTMNWTAVNLALEKAIGGFVRAALRSTTP